MKGGLTDERKITEVSVKISPDCNIPEIKPVFKVF